MGYVLLNYDIKCSNREFMEGGYSPPDKVFGISVTPNENESIMIRRRVRD